MDAPICRLCGIKHWGSEHVWPKAPKPSAAPKGEPVPFQSFVEAEALIEPKPAAEDPPTSDKPTKPRAGRKKQDRAEGLFSSDVEAQASKANMTQEEKKRANFREYMRNRHIGRAHV